MVRWPRRSWPEPSWAAMQMGNVRSAMARLEATPVGVIQTQPRRYRKVPAPHHPLRVTGLLLLGCRRWKGRGCDRARHRAADRARQ